MVLAMRALLIASTFVLSAGGCKDCKERGVAATTIDSHAGANGVSDAESIATEVAWRLDCDETDVGCQLSSDVPLMVRGDAGIPKLAPDCKAIRRELLTRQIGGGSEGCATNDECIPTELCIVVPKPLDFWIKDSRRRWEARSCPIFSECQSAERLCYLGKCVQPWDKVARTRMGDLPPGLQKAKDVDQQCLRKAIRAYLEKCKADLETLFGRSARVDFDIILQPGKVSMYANPSRWNTDQQRAFEQRLAGCMKTQIEGTGEVFHCFAGGWVRIPWKVNFDR
jgi:hypothetical protein